MLNDEQQKAYDAMCAGENVFLTGNAGTGKSFIIKKFIEEHKNCGMCANGHCCKQYRWGNTS